MHLPYNYRPQKAGPTKKGTTMSKSKYGNSNLYMTTREFADMVIDALDEQSYFKKDDVAHPQDIAYAFSTVGETVGKAMEWAIKQEVQVANKKNAVMETKNLRKNALPIDDEIAPALLQEGEPLVDELGYNEWRNKKGYM